MRVPRQVLVYLFRHGDDGGREVLLLRRTPEHGGFWQGVSGAPDWGESDHDAAAREVLEETGFSVAGSLRPIGFRFELRRQDGNRDEWAALYGPDIDAVPEEVYAAEVASDGDPVLAPREHDAFAWCTVEQAIELLKWEDNRRALVAAERFVAGLSPGGAGRSPS